MTIRNYTHFDHKAIQNLFELNSPDFFHAAEKKDLLNYLTVHHATYFVAMRRNEIIGACGYHIAQASGTISWSFVHPFTRNKGVGSQLILHCIQCLHSAGVTKVTLTTSNFAYKYFEKFGFRVIEIKENFWAPGHNLLHMELLAAKTTIFNPFEA